MIYIGVENGKIQSISVPVHDELMGAPQLTDRALSVLIGQKLSQVRVDVVSGATMTSNAINNGLKMAAMMNGYVQEEPVVETTPEPTMEPVPQLRTLEDYMEYYQLPDSELGYFNVNQTLAVYTGPSRGYYRASSGKATVSTNGEVKSYGTVDGGDYYLIRYKLNNGNRRFGYIRRKDIEGSYVLPETPITECNVPVIVTKDATLTDDPGAGRSNDKVCKIKKGAKGTLLFFRDEYACVDFETSDVGRVRGFMLASEIKLAE